MSNPKSRYGRAIKPTERMAAYKAIQLEKDKISLELELTKLKISQCEKELQLKALLSSSAPPGLLHESPIAKSTPLKNQMAETDTRQSSRPGATSASCGETFDVSKPMQPADYDPNEIDLLLKELGHLTFAEVNKNYLDKPSNANGKVNENTKGNSNSLDKPRKREVDTNSKINKVSLDMPSNGDTESSEDNLVSVLNHLKRPSIEIKKFGGDPIAYHRFIRQFRSNIVPYTSNDDERFNYLEQYTYGQPHQIVLGYSFLPGTTGYKAALKELDSRYGSNEVICDAFIKKALNWPPIKNDDPEEIDNFAIFLTEANNAIKNIASLQVLEYPDNLKRLVQKLPFRYHYKWRNTVQDATDSGKAVKFQLLVDMVQKEAKKLMDPLYGKNAMMNNEHPKMRPEKPRRQFVSNFTENQDRSVRPKGPICYHCGKTHVISDCEEFRDIEYDNKVNLLKEKGLCFGCLNRGHRFFDCKQRKICEICSETHPTVLHKTIAPQEQAIKPKVSSATGLHSLEGECTMPIVHVRVKSSINGQFFDTYALMDSASNSSFITEKLLLELNMPAQTSEITLDTMAGPITLSSNSINYLEIYNKELSDSITVSTLYSKRTIPVDHDHIPTSLDISQYKHLEGIPLIKSNHQTDIGLLIGNDVPDAYTPLDVKTGPRGTPHATRTRLGWILWNVIRNTPCSQQNLSTCRTHLVKSSPINEEKQLDVLIKRAFDVDFPEITAEDKTEKSVLDNRFMNKVEDSTKIENGNYTIGIPFVENDVVLPQNIKLAESRLESLKRKMSRNTEFATQYTKSIESMLEKGYIENVPTEATHTPGNIWYLPHHGVFHKRKNKLRVVFDCSAKYQDVSLNDMLLQEPDFTNALLGILLRFRMGKVAIMADIEAMFMQIIVPPSDRDVLRFLWWPNGDTSLELHHYRVTRHLFGALSSPSCANYALRRTALDNALQFHQLVTETILNDFYVDDLLKSLDSVPQAIDLIHSLRANCKLGGFNLHKWASNSTEAIDSITINDQALPVQNMKEDDNPQIETALGIPWNTRDDTFSYKISVKPEERGKSRRGILSVVSSFYDPIGLICPAIFPAKSFLQRLCSKGVTWDQQLCNSDSKWWNRWLEDLPTLANLAIPRCIKPQHFDQVVSTSLHHFSDASDQGYGVTCYLRLVDAKGAISSSLIFAKSRVAPLKKITTPRMELAAATLAVKIDRQLRNEIKEEIDATYFWTDSTAVLKYIANDHARYQTFVANRVSVIREATNIEQWLYVNTRDNPADDASRGLKIPDFVNKRRWFQGPDFLTKTESGWPKTDISTRLTSDDPEVKKCAAVVTQKTSDHCIDKLLAHYSNYDRLLRSVAHLRRVFVMLRKKLLNKNDAKESPHALKLTPNDIAKAESLIIAHEQNKFLHDTLQSVQQSKRIKCVHIAKLDPFMQDELLRVGGRLKGSNLEFNAKHQIIVPKESLLAKLLVRRAHEAVGHMGKNSVLAKLRQRYWIINANRAIKSIISKCILCRKYKATKSQQKMADLPIDRISPVNRPFYHTGMDFFGPFEIKRARSALRRYGVIFTCASSRAIHLEMACSLDTDSCINAIRGFIARRGTPQLIRSDNGTNIVGAERELRECIENINSQSISNACLQKGISWTFNPPSASHYGGFWERQIRTVRKVLYSVMKQQTVKLDDESFATMLCEVESIVNNRPITKMAQSPNDLDMLTPNHLLLSDAERSHSPCISEATNVYARKRWKQVQYLTDLFWTRWSSEYLPSLQQRQKWLFPEKNVAVNDIVLIADNTMRNSWSLGRVVEVYKRDSGLVRTVKVKTQTATYKRPIHKLCVILEADLE